MQQGNDDESGTWGESVSGLI